MYQAHNPCGTRVKTRLELTKLRLDVLYVHPRKPGVIGEEETGKLERKSRMLRLSRKA